MAPQVPRWNTRDAPVRCSESKALSRKAMAMMMLMGQKTRTFVVLSQKTVLTRKVSYCPLKAKRREGTYGFGRLSAPLWWVNLIAMAGR